MYLAILGRQPSIGIAELESVYGPDSLQILSRHAIIIDSDNFAINRLGGTPKAGRVIEQINNTDWDKVCRHITKYYIDKWSSLDYKITLGISTYGFQVGTREIQKIGITIKQGLKKHGVSLRLIPNADSALNTATSHHNKLGLSPNKVELLIARGNGLVIMAESIGAQNITAYARRDQNRPKRDAFVGMLPPKLAQIMVNLATGSNNEKQITVLDPFCGTGVILQEAALMGYGVYGTDLSNKMIDYSSENMNWLSKLSGLDINLRLHQGDATNTKWQPPVDTVVCESYLGQPFSAPPSPQKLKEVVTNCNQIITEFLKNLHGQIPEGTSLCIAIPAWRSRDGKFTHLPLIDTVARLGYRPREFRHTSKNDLVYYRDNQVVARELFVLTRT